jgi:hypothetical protein
MTTIQKMPTGRDLERLIAEKVWPQGLRPSGWSTDTGEVWELLEWMKDNGSSLILNWGEDPHPLWEVSWITHGKRFTGVASDWKLAVCWSALKAALREEDNW